MPAYARGAGLAALAFALIVMLSGAQSAAPVRVGEPPPEVASGGSRAGADGSGGSHADTGGSRAGAYGAGGSRAESFRSARTYPVVPSPVRLRIPALQVESRLDGLGLQPDGSVEVPRKEGRAGWYDRGPRPGQDGPAVILGHVDSRTGPGIFADLVTVKAGTLVHVDRADGSTATFRITHLQKVAKTEFPTDLVYAPSLDPTLRLVTCGGSFDHARGSYRDNVIAFADLV